MGGPGKPVDILMKFFVIVLTVSRFMALVLTGLKSKNPPQTLGSAYRLCIDLSGMHMVNSKTIWYTSAREYRVT